MIEFNINIEIDDLVFSDFFISILPNANELNSDTTFIDLGKGTLLEILNCKTLNDTSLLVINSNKNIS